MAGQMILANAIFMEHSRLAYNKIFSINETDIGRGHALPAGETVVGGQGSDKHAADHDRGSAPAPGKTRKTGTNVDESWPR